MPYAKRVKRYAKRQGTRAFGFAKKRYYNKRRKTINLGKMLRDVQTVKSIVNSEKKQISGFAGSSSLGQVNGNAEGAYTLDITPGIPQGTTDSTRTGDSVKLTTAMFKFQVSQQSANTGPVRVKLRIYKVLGTPQATSLFLNQISLPNVFVTGANIRDYNSQPDQDYRQQYVKIAERRFTIRGDNFSGQNTIKNIDLPIKFGKYGHHIKYAENTNVIASGQLMMIVQCDTGNLSAGTPSTLGGVLNTAVNTGLFINRSMTFYYYDN